MKRIGRFLKRHGQRLTAASIAGVLFALWIPIFARILGFAPIGRLHFSDQTEVRAVSNDGRILVTIRNRPGETESWLQHSLEVWNVPTGLLLWTINTGAVNFGEAAISPNGQMLAVEASRQDKTGEKTLIEIYAIQSGQLLMCFDRGNAPAGVSFAFSPTGDVLAVTGIAKSHIHLWDLIRKREYTSLEAFAGTFVFSPDGEFLLSFDSGGGDYCSVWDVRTGRKTLTLSRADGDYRSAAFGETPGELVSARCSTYQTSLEAEDFHIDRWDCRTGLKIGSTNCRGWETYHSPAIIQRDDSGKYSILDLTSGCIINMRMPHGIDVIEEDLSPRFHKGNGSIITLQGPKPAALPFLPIFNHARSADEGSYVLYDCRTGAHVGTIPTYLLAEFNGDVAMEVHADGVVDVWHIPPHRPIGLILLLAFLHTALILGPCWYFARRR